MNLLGRNQLKKRRMSRRKKQPARGTALNIPCPELLQLSVLICQEKHLNRTFMTNIPKVTSVCLELLHLSESKLGFVNLILSS